MAKSRLSSPFSKIRDSGRKKSGESSGGNYESDEKSVEVQNASFGTDTSAGDGANVRGTSRTSGFSMMKRFLYAGVVVASAAIGFAVGDGVSFLFAVPNAELDPTSEVGIELDRLDGEISELREGLSNIAIPDPAVLSSAEQQRQSFEQRIGILETGLEDGLSRRNADAGRFEALAQADRDLSTQLEAQGKFFDAQALEMDFMSGELERLLPLHDEVSEIRNRFGQITEAGSNSQAVAAKLETLGQRLTAVEGRSVSDPEIDGVAANQSNDMELLRTNFAELESRLYGIQSETAGLLSLPGEIEKIRSQFHELETEIGLLADSSSSSSESELISLHDERLRVLEDGVSRIREESASSIQSLRQDIIALDSEIRASLDTAATRIAYSRIFEAIYSGRPYSDFLDEVDWVQPEEGETLALYAETGVNSLDELQELFLSRARETLKSAQIEGESGQGVTSFLKSLVVVRTLLPQEGNDVGSVLSRAEAALNGGRLRTALGLVESLPEDSRRSMREWSDASKSRLAALDAIRISSSAASVEVQE